MKVIHYFFFLINVYFYQLTAGPHIAHNGMLTILLRRRQVNCRGVLITSRQTEKACRRVCCVGADLRQEFRVSKNLNPPCLPVPKYITICF